MGKRGPQHKRRFTDAEAQTIMRRHIIGKETITALAADYRVRDDLVSHVVRQLGEYRDVKVPQECKRELARRGKMLAAATALLNSGKSIRETCDALQAEFSDICKSPGVLSGLIHRGTIKVAADAAARRSFSAKLKAAYERHQDILSRFQNGETPKQIAATVGLDRYHVRRILRRKFGLLAKPERPPARPKVVRIRLENGKLAASHEGAVVDSVNGYPSKTFADLDLRGDAPDAVCECRMYIGDPYKGPTLFCGAPSEPGLPYCASHCRVAYQPPKQREKDENRRPAPRHYGSNFRMAAE